MTKNIGPAGLEMVKRCEGYGHELQDGSGSCTAYQERINGKLDIPTIGYGCTKGVTMGAVWTREHAEAVLLKELEQHAKRVDRLVTVELNEHERDALISFDFNTGGLTTEAGASGVLKAINSGDRAKTVEQLKRWTKFGGKVCEGLVSRRAEEVALFLRPVGSVPTSYMPQQPTQERRKFTTTEKAAGAMTALELARQTVANTDALSTARKTVDKGKELKSVVEDARGLGAGLVPKSLPVPMIGVGMVIAAVAVIGFVVMRARG